MRYACFWRGQHSYWCCRSSLRTRANFQTESVPPEETKCKITDGLVCSECRHRDCNQGGDKMRLGLFLTTLVGLAGASHISSAADATWAAVGALENGMSTSCGGGSIPLPEWTGPAYGQVDTKGNTLTFMSTSAIPN